MTGAEHYREAERLLAEVSKVGMVDEQAELIIVATLIQRATVHALLAGVEAAQCGLRGEMK